LRGPTGTGYGSSVPTHFRTCNLCEAMCGIAIETDGPRILSIRGDRDDPFSQGHICPKAVALQDVHDDPDRIRRPMRRRGTTWEEVSWDEALTEAARRLAAVQAAHGRDAVAVYQGNPTVHNHGSTLFGPLLLKSLGTRNVYSATSVDQLPHMLAAFLMFGHQVLLPVPDIDRTRLFVMFGANPLASNGSLMTAPGMKRRLEALRARGGRLVVIDPRRTETAALADIHLPIRPGTDALLLLAILQELFASGHVRPGRLAAFTDGLDEIARLVLPFTPEAVTAATGIAAVDIRALAREIGETEPAVVYGRVGLSTQEFGGLSSWLVTVLNVVTGNLDRAGGFMFTRAAVDLVALAVRLGQQGRFAKRHSRVRGLPDFGGEYPVATLADEIETPGPGQVRALVTSAGNPVLSTPNGGRLEKALGGLDFMVSIDFYLNETTRHAHLILPPTAALEHDHYDVVFHTLAVRNTAKYSPPLFDAGPGARHDWQILLELSSRLDAAKGRHGMRARLTRGVLRRLGLRGLLDLLLRTGPHGAGFRPFGRGLRLRTLERAPHGIDLGPLEPCLPERLYTRSKKIELAPRPFVEDLERLRPRLAVNPEGTRLQLIGRRDVRSNNSWMHNSARLVKGRDRCTLLMHPDDASHRGLEDGQRVRIESRVGAVEAGLQVTADVRAGVVCLPHGWGHHRPGTRLAVAEAHPGVSFNDLSDELALDALCGTAAFSGTPVEVTAS
jgi:anaerobic selenocysteine-containing dehydrogenase